MATPGRKPSGNKPTEKTERIVAYLSKPQMERVHRYAKEKLSLDAADAAAIRIMLMQFLDMQGIK